MQVALKKPVELDEVDTEIVVVSGCALGFVAPGQPLHVLHVDPGTEMATHGVSNDDLLVGIDGNDPRNLTQAEVAKALSTATTLSFERPKAPPEEDEGTEPPSDGEGRRAGKETNASATPAPAPATTPEGSAAPAAEAEKAAPAEGADGRHRHGRSRSPRRHRRSDTHYGGQGESRARRRGSAGDNAAHPNMTPGSRGPWGEGWPPPAGEAGPPPRWVGNAPWGPPPAGYRPPHQHPPAWDPWHVRPPEHWHGPGAPPPHGEPCARERSPRRRHARDGPPPRLEQAEGGGYVLVAELVSPSVNNMDVLNEYFGTFGPVTALQINHHRHEAIITFGRLEDAEEALRWPVLNDPSIGLRPWRSKGKPSSGNHARADAAPTSFPVAQVGAPPAPPVASGPPPAGPPPAGPPPQVHPQQVHPQQVHHQQVHPKQALLLLAPLRLLLLLLLR